MTPIFPSSSPGTATSKSPLVGVQKVVVVNSSPEILAFAERALAAAHYDVVFVESLHHAYSQIRRVQPNLAVMCLRMDDPDAFQLLSMLKLDPETRNVPLLTYTLNDDPERIGEEPEEPAESEFFSAPPPMLMN